MAFSKRIQEAWGNRWYALPFLALMGLLSCTGEKNTDVLPTVDLTGVTNRTEIKLSDVTSDVTYVKLETNDSCLIGNNFQLYADDQYILITFSFMRTTNTFSHSPMGRSTCSTGKMDILCGPSRSGARDRASILE